ncbi:ribosomal RNA processing protein 36 homolog [Stegodyphus dumicola]|uniref:ribosomal RNA processing protein 36 homolog n=1 Tax=Stegodyphus dumicola TaxID=202533 RepID=UPI0015AAD2FA|nr:ribosomal RNA processing protein 36 homolog [Stegodyphus dumicola]
MATLNDYPNIAQSLNTASTKHIKLLHRLVFGSDGDNDVDQDDVAVVDEDHVNEDDVDDNEDHDDDDSHKANDDDDDVDNDPNVQNTEETVKNKLNQFEQACADQANKKTPAKSAETPKEQKAWKYKRRKFKRTSKTMKLLTQHDDEKAALCIEAQRNLLRLHQAHIRQYKKRRKPARKYKLGHQMPIRTETST